jgi:hypothetical protein
MDCALATLFAIAQPAVPIAIVMTAINVNLRILLFLSMHRDATETP